MPKRSRPPLLHIESLTVRRGDTALLDEVDWTVGRSENWVILGPNGCGKTSLIKALTGYLSPTAGKITLLGQRYGRSDWRELRLKIGLVTSALQASIPPAEPALETVVSGRYAQLDLWVDFTARDRTDALRWLRLAHIEDLAERSWAYLSQGERQRVLIARALMAAPRLLILDEPCGGLDPVARERFLKFIEILAGRRGAPALVLVTHHVEEITGAFTHALVMSGGRVVAAGPRASTLRAEPLSKAFGVPMRLNRHRGRLALQLKLPRRDKPLA